MGIEEIQREQRWKIINMPNRPAVIVKNIDKYSETIYWSYENDDQINESTLEYFLKTFRRQQ